MKKAGKFVVQGTVQKVQAGQASCPKFSLKILDRKSFESEFRNFQFILTCSTGGFWR